jgi:hypothetical protein
MRKVLFAFAIAVGACTPKTAPTYPNPYVAPNGRSSAFLPGKPVTGIAGSGTSGKSARFTGTATIANGSMTDDGAGHVTISNNSGYAFSAFPSGTDADNRGFQCSSTWAGALGVGYCFHGLMSANSPQAAYAAKFGAVNTGGGAAVALNTSDGDVLLGEQTGKLTIGLDTIVSAIRNHTDGSAATHTFQLGVGGTSNVMLVEKHNTAPVAAAACQTGSNFSAPVDNKWSDFTLGSGATFPCVITLASPCPCSNTPSILVVAHNGANQASLNYTVTGSAITIAAGTPGATYSWFAGGH